IRQRDESIALLHRAAHGDISLDGEAVERLQPLGGAGAPRADEIAEDARHGRTTLAACAPRPQRQTRVRPWRAPPAPAVRPAPDHPAAAPAPPPALWDRAPEPAAPRAHGRSAPEFPRPASTPTVCPPPSPP